MRKMSARKGMPYVSIALFADELVLERCVRGQVRRRAPHRVIGRIQRDLRPWGFVSDHHLSIIDRRTHRVGLVPITKLRQTPYDENILPTPLSATISLNRRPTQRHSPRRIRSSRFQRIRPTPAVPSLGRLLQHPSHPYAQRSLVADQWRRSSYHHTRSRICKKKPHTLKSKKHETRTSRTRSHYKCPIWTGPL
jgi:hypothetical protein